MQPALLAAGDPIRLLPVRNAAKYRLSFDPGIQFPARFAAALIACSLLFPQTVRAQRERCLAPHLSYGLFHPGDRSAYATAFARSSIKKLCGANPEFLFANPVTRLQG